MNRSKLNSQANPALVIPHVAILMATYNGEHYLQEQLDSIASQTEKNWVLWVSDDGSSDATMKILKNFSKNFPAGKISIVNGPKTGFANNFLSLIYNPLVSAQFFAFADQDDVWFDDKLERAINCLKQFSTEVPALYCSRTEFVDRNLAHIGFSDENKRPPSFLNALVQNIASGNTMVFNQAACNLLVKAGREINIPLHDWWTYLVVTACAGKVYFDPRPSLYYRQHENNLWGMNTGWRNRGKRIKKLFEGRFQQWNGQHISALNVLNARLNMDSKETINIFIKIREEALIQRLFYLKKSGLYRQSLLGNIGLWVGTIFHKV